MRQASTSNKRRRTPLIDNNFTHIIIYATLLTVKYSKEAYARLKKGKRNNFLRHNSQTLSCPYWKTQA